MAEAPREDGPYVLPVLVLIFGVVVVGLGMVVFAMDNEDAEILGYAAYLVGGTLASIGSIACGVVLGTAHSSRRPR